MVVITTAMEDINIILISRSATVMGILIHMDMLDLDTVMVLAMDMPSDTVLVMDMASVTIFTAMAMAMAMDFLISMGTITMPLRDTEKASNPNAAKLTRTTSDQSVENFVVTHIKLFSNPL